MRKAPLKKKGGDPLWLVSYADVVTLMLCFMVLLVSLSVIDERLKREVLGSVSRTYASAVVFKMEEDPQALDLARLQQGLGAQPITGSDLAPMKEMVTADNPDDLNFMENRFVQIISLNEAALFEPGKTQLSPTGERLLDKLLPQLLRIQYPLLVAGHAAPRMDEEQGFYILKEDRAETDPTWMISLHRASSVYRYLIARGMPPEKVTNESFGQFRPRFPTTTPEGRKKNRRVDLVLDKRNTQLIEAIKNSRLDPKTEEAVHEYKGFKFDLTMPERPGGRSTDADSLESLPSDIHSFDLEGEALSPESPSAQEPKAAPDYWNGTSAP